MAYITPCPHCEAPIRFPASHRPGPGDAIECPACKRFGAYTEAATLRTPTTAESDLIELDKIASSLSAAVQNGEALPETVLARLQTLGVRRLGANNEIMERLRHFRQSTLN